MQTKRKAPGSKMVRVQLASNILAGLLASSQGRLTEDQLIEKALYLADKLQEEG